MEDHRKKFSETAKGKIIIAFAFISAALMLTFFINRVAFQRMTSIIDELSAPNRKMIALTRLHRDVSGLMDLQRIEAMGDKSEPSETFIRETRNVESELDTLRMLFDEQSAQLKRLNSIDSLMSMRNQLFLKYLKVRYNYVKKGVLDKQLQALSSQIDKENLKIDSNVITTEKSVRTTTIIPGEQQESPKKWRLFGKKPKEQPRSEKPQVIIEENTKVQVDTLAVASRDSILSKIESSIAEIETDRNQGRKYVRNKEMALIQTNDLLIRELLNVIREVESEEMAQVKAKNRETVEVADQTIGFMRIITAGFLLVAVVLATLIISDISRSNRYRRELEAAKAEAEYHSMAKQRFLSNMSHEIRTPLQSIIGYSEQLSQQSPDENVSAISRSSRHLLQVVNEVLDYSRIISGKFTFEQKPFALNETLLDVLKTIRLQAESKGLELTYDIPEEETMLSGDAFRLRQVLYNLLGNAVKFTAQGNILLNAATTVHKSSVTVRFEISDEGKGMDEEDLKRIFNQFEQARNENVQSGTGLGLSIVKELIEAQGGRISVESEPGKGSVFSFSITYGIPAETQTAEGQETIHASFEGKVWVVDDDALILNLCALIFRKHGIAYACFDSAEKLLAAEPDPELRLIFADVRLPGMSGIELTRAWRERNSRVPVIALTAQVLPEEKEHLMQSGYDDLLLKPFTESQLLAFLGHGKPPEDRPVTAYDFSELQQMIPDPEALEEIIRQFESDMENDRGQLKAALENNDREQVVLLVHRMAGRTGQMGQAEISAQWRSLEKRLRKNEKVSDAEILDLAG